MKNKDLVALVTLLLLIITVCVEATLPSTTGDTLFPHFDKVAHFVVFGLIAYLCAYLLHRYDIATDKIRLAGILLFVVVLGIFVEWLQSHTPGRVATIYDLIANIIGAGIFLALWKWQVLHRK